MKATRRPCPREVLYGISIDSMYQFRPDVFTAVVDAIALIRNSKRDVLTLFRGAGLVHPKIDEYERQIRVDRNALRKAEMAHTRCASPMKRRETPDLRYAEKY